MPPFASLPEGVRKDIIAYLFGDAPKEAPKVSDDVSTDIPYIFGGYTRLLDDKGYPGIAPPWGTLTAVDVGAGTIKWQVTLGDRPEARRPKDPPTGTENYGGPAITAGRRAVHRRHQRREVPRLRHADRQEAVGGLAAGRRICHACTYVVDGRQYVVIAAGGGKMGTKSGDTYVAYALPERTARSRRGHPPGDSTDAHR